MAYLGNPLMVVLLLQENKYGNLSDTNYVEKSNKKRNILDGRFTIVYNFIIFQRKLGKQVYF